MKRKLSWLLSIALTLSLTSPLLHAEDNTVSGAKSTANASSKKLGKSGKVEEKAVELFDAIEQELVTVEFIGKDATEANILFRNNGNEPVHLIMPVHSALSQSWLNSVVEAWEPVAKEVVAKEVVVLEAVVSEAVVSVEAASAVAARAVAVKV